MSDHIPPPPEDVIVEDVQPITTLQEQQQQQEAGPLRSGACSLSATCTAKNQELSDQYRCRHCNRQLHGFISGCSQAKNPKDFRDGVICKVQPCYTESKASAGRPDGAVSSFVLN
jgi:hypothetical protein